MALDAEQPLEAAAQPRPDLELTADLRFQRREWRAERIGWVLAGVVIVASLLGVFSNGPLSSTSSSSSSGDIRVDYQHFVRHLGQDSMTITVAPSAIKAGTATIVLDQSIASALQITSITPQPQAQRTEQGRLVLEVAAAPGAPAQVQIQYQPAHGWLQTGRVSAGAGREGAQLWEFVYP